LARGLDVLLCDQQPAGHNDIRPLRLLVTEALHALDALVDDLQRPRWEASLEKGLRAAAAEYAAATGAVAQIDIRGSVDNVPDELAATLRLAVTEALRNVNRYSRAGFLLLSLDVRDTFVALDIVDDGVDLAARQAPAWGSAVELGLLRIQRAVQATGGRLTLHHLRPRGLRLRAVVPGGVR
jgi:signal transduction histidine kinase